MPSPDVYYETSAGLHWIDGTVIVAYISGMLALGAYYNRRQNSVDEYFVGNRGMPPLLIGISLFATLMSTISYLSSPGEIIKYGPYMLAGVLAIPVSYVLVAYVIIPKFMQYRLTSAYELLEMKLGLEVRLLGATMFIVLRLVWMAVLLNFAAHALLVMLDLDEMWLFPVTAGIGAVAIAYSSMGGLRAVVITDFVQFLLLFGGAVLVMATVTIHFGGFDWFPTEWQPHWKKQKLFSFNPDDRLTILGVIAMQSLWTVCTAGSDQTAVQRYMATSDAKAARKAYLINSLASLAVGIVMTCMGLSLMAFFNAHVEALPDGESVYSAADTLFPRYISHHLPVGLSGLVVSAMFAAAMSSIDSGVNSISAVVMTDFIDRFRTTSLSENVRVRVAQLLAVTVGVIVVGSSGLIELVPGNLLEVAKRTTGLLVTPLFTLFFLAIFVRFATPAGAISGSLCGFAIAVVIAFWNPLFSEDSVTITWINPLAFTVSMSIGCGVSWLTHRPNTVNTPDQDSA